MNVVSQIELVDRLVAKSPTQTHEEFTSDRGVLMVCEHEVVRIVHGALADQQTLVKCGALLNGQPWLVEMPKLTARAVNRLANAKERAVKTYVPVHSTRCGIETNKPPGSLVGAGFRFVAHCQSIKMAAGLSARVRTNHSVVNWPT